MQPPVLAETLFHLDFRFLQHKETEAPNVPPIQETVMKKSELIDAVAALRDTTKADAATIVDMFFDPAEGLISKSLKAGEEMKISGFGIFSVAHRAARKGVNPKKPTEKIDIPASKTPRFRAGRTLREALQ